VVEYDGWGFEGARAAMKDSNSKTVVDIDEIIRRRKDRINAAAKGQEEEGDSNVNLPSDKGDQQVATEKAVDSGSEDEDGFKVFDEDDEDIADDAFGMGVDSDLESENDTGLGTESDEALDSDNEEAGFDSNSESSIASEVPHPDDDVDSDSDPDKDDVQEAAKKAAFFAPEDEITFNPDPSASFQNMNLSRPILRGLTSVGFTTPTLIQQKTIPVALLGKDVVGGAQTGSGKTAAFVVPILERLLYRPKKIPTSRVLILCPTRELAMQCHSVAVKLAAYTDIKFALAVGGLSLKVQEAELKKRPDVIIATPGRFIDHMRNSQGFNVETIEIVVMDEADRMLEDGFADELDEIIKTIPKSRQTMLFSATMTDSVDKLVRLSLNRPVRLMVNAKKSTVKALVQEFVRIRPQREKYRLAMLLYICNEQIAQTAGGCIIFFRSKVYAHRVRVVFGLFGLKAAELHGSLSQEQRMRAVESFRDGHVDYLLATDLASRGLDIKNVSVVINFEAPQSHEIYLHRVGRTARAGRSGRAITLAAESDRKIVKAAVRAAQTQSATVVSRILDTDKVNAVHAHLQDIQSEIQHVLQEEKQDKEIATMEMQVRRTENVLNHQEEILARPKRTWFETQREKEVAKSVGRAELNGIELPEVKKRISGKKRKREEMQGERGYKKTKTDRVEKGARSGVKAALKRGGSRGCMKRKGGGDGGGRGARGRGGREKGKPRTKGKR
jgi:ATP-dependent RNA helicase DDX27